MATEPSVPIFNGRISLIFSLGLDQQTTDTRALEHAGGLDTGKGVSEVATLGRRWLRSCEINDVYVVVHSSKVSALTDSY